MRTRIVCCFGVVVALALVAASAFASSSAWKRYTFLEPPSQLASPGTLTVAFPAGWRVKIPGSPKVNPSATAVYRSETAWWWVGGSLEERSTTISDVRARMLGWAGTPMWGEGTPMRVYVGDSYVTLPMGKVWRYTLALVPAKGDTKSKLSYDRYYVLDRGVARDITGTPKHFFLTFTIMCTAQGCKNHNGQLAAIMRSIRITP